MSYTIWKKVAQEAEKVRDLALEAKAAAEIARVTAERERDTMRLCSKSVTRTSEMLKQERDQARERASNLSVELAAMTLSRDQARQEVDLLRRQVDVLAAVCSSHALIGTNMVGTALEWAAWSARQAKEGGK
jgi:hypothetical protein